MKPSNETKELLQILSDEAFVKQLPVTNKILRRMKKFIVWFETTVPSPAFLRTTDQTIAHKLLKKIKFLENGLFSMCCADQFRD
jgi:hypothetical protein